MRKLFGTDGIRGEAGLAPLDGPTMYRLGRALAAWLERAGEESPAVCLGRDTRESGAYITACLASGLGDGGARAVSAGVLPTPGLALVTRSGPYRAGLMVSASHNPYHDNGVKVLDADGAKLPDDAEREIELLLDEQPMPAADRLAGRPIEDDPGPEAAYLEFLERCLEGNRLDGLRIVVDTAHGAAFRLAPAALRRAGAEVIVLADAPDGRNINEGVGSMHPDVVARAVVEHRADLGFAFDGDADRCIGASRSGAILDGDFTLYYAGRALDRSGRLPGRTVVGTVMSNLGLEKALERAGLRLHRTPVGDRYVLQALREGGWTLGGEQSGHVIFLDHAPTGDGILTALTIARLMAAGEGDPDTVRDELPRFPQVLRNVRVRSKPRIEDHPALADAVRRAERAMGEDGRIVVRYSGTEPKARVMVEGADAALVERLAAEVADVFEREVGF